jgi:DNA-binding NtrC family response regulator
LAAGRNQKSFAEHDLCHLNTIGMTDAYCTPSIGSSETMGATMKPTRHTDDFLDHVLPGSSEAAIRFREEIAALNLYCHRYKGAIGCVLLTGESGVGKNYTARAISAHSQWLTLTDDEKRDTYYVDGKIRLSPVALVEQLLFKQHRAQRGGEPKRVPRLATVLGTQLADDLAGSELFGHKKHAFTGAEKDHPGIFGDKSVDDVLLDEIGDLSSKVQAKLLQFIETRTFRPVGGIAADEDTSDQRLFLATNRPLEKLVVAKEFREDLYRRIQGFRLHILPLRERKDTIRELVISMLRSVNQRHRGDEERGPSLPQAEAADHYCLLPREEWPSTRPYRSNWVLKLEPEDLEWCEQYSWPGNARELRQRLDLYVFRNGHCRLANVMPEQRHAHHPGFAGDQKETDSHQLVALAVEQHLDRVLSGVERAPGQPGKLLSLFQDFVKTAVYEFKAKRRLGREEIATLFPDARDADTTIGRWRPGNGRSEDP